MFNVSKKIILSGAIGNILEMYDYAIWGLFSVFLSKAFLPEHSNLSDVFFLKKNCTFNYIYLSGAKINLTKSLTDSTFNYQFLVDALAGNSDKKMIR